MPPIVASAPGSMKKQMPVPESAWLSCMRVIPACIVPSMSSGLTRSRRFIRVMSMHTPPLNAATWPSTEVPAPKDTTGTRWAAHSVTISRTSSFVSGNATPSGAADRW